MRTVICTGNGGIGSGLLAAATASTAARAGKRTLLASIGPSHSLGALFGVTLGNSPQELAPGLDVWALDAPAELSRLMEQVRPRLTGVLASLSSDELPLIVGSDFFLALECLRAAEAAGYRLVVVDAGPHDMLLRVLALPDSFRWFVRLLFGLDRGPGQSNASLARALLPTSLLPTEWTGQVQETRARLERLRETVTTPSRATVRYALQPDPAGLDEARLAVPALQLHGLAVDALVAGPLLPADVSDGRLAAMAAQQQALIGQAERIWNGHPVLRLPLLTTPANPATFAAMGLSLYGSLPPDDVAPCPAPIAYQSGPEPTLAIRLPGVPREALHLTLSGDELIVRIGPYRRHILLPDGMRGRGAIRASREAEQLLVRLRRQDGGAG